MRLALAPASPCGSGRSGAQQAARSPRPRSAAVVCAAAKPRRDAQGRELEEKVRCRSAGSLNAQPAKACRADGLPQSCDQCGGIGKIKCFDCNLPDGFVERVRAALAELVRRR
jgi:hypothetical protein